MHKSCKRDRGREMGDVDEPLIAEPSADHSSNSEQVGTRSSAGKTPALARQAVASVRLARRRIGGALIKSLIAVLVGSLILRLASHATGQMTQFYLGYINKNLYHISHITRGYVIASFFITELVGSLVLGAMSDRYGRKLFIMLGPAFGVIAVQLTAMTSVIWLLVLARLLEGLSTGSSIPSTLGYISEATVGRPSLRARVMGMFEITLVGGIALGAVIGGYLWKFFESPRTVAGITLQSPAFSISIVGLIYLVSLAVFAWGLRDVKREAAFEETVSSHAGALRKKLKHYSEVFKAPSVWMFIPAWLSIFSIIGIWANLSYGLLSGEHFKGQKLTGSVTPESFGNGFAALAVFFAVGVLAWSFVLARFRKTNVMLIGTLSLFGLLLTTFGLNHMGSFSSPGFYLLLGALLIEVLVMSGFTPAALTYLADVTENYAADRGSIMGLYSVFLGVGQLTGTSLGGYFADWNGVDGLILLSAILGGITAISLLALRRREISEARRLEPRQGSRSH
jgi:MFS family permease